jgi:serine/threonine protein kinase
MYYCMKIMSKSRVVRLKQQDHVNSELRVLAMLHHPFCIGFHQSFQDDFNLYLVMDYVPGGEVGGVCVCVNAYCLCVCVCVCVFVFVCLCVVCEC